MKSRAFFVSLFLATSPLWAQGGWVVTSGGQQPQSTSSKTDPAKGTGSIEGTITSTEGERPVRKATVTLTLIGPPPGTSSGGGGVFMGAIGGPGGGQQAQTDADGHFAFNDLAAGRYNIMVQHPTYVGTGRQGRIVSTQVSLGNDQHIKDTNFRLVAAGVIRGKITDEDGDPMARAQVQAMQQRYLRGRKQFFPAGVAQTDDLGEFRISGLAPGSYYLSAVRLNFMQPAVTTAAKGPQRQYVRTYYPSAIDLPHASVVELRSGDELPLNWSLVQAETVLVRGTVYTATGDKAATGTVLISGGGDSGSFAQSPAIINNGAFEIRVVPGHYRATAMVMADPQQPGSMTFSTVVLDVPPEGVENARLQAQNTAHITARVRVEGSPSDFKYENVNIQLVKRSEEDDDLFSNAFGSGASGRASKDGTVELDKVTPGLYDVVWNSAGGGFDNYYLKAVVAGGHDVGEAGLRVGESTAQIQIVIAPNPPKVDGMVTDAEQRAVKGATVVLIPDGDLRKRDQNFRTALTDQAGHFNMRSVRPGHYTVVALQDPEPGIWMDPDFIATVERQGERLVAVENDRKTMQLKITAGTLAQASGQ